MHVWCTNYSHHLCISIITPDTSRISFLNQDLPFIHPFNFHMLNNDYETLWCFPRTKGKKCYYNLVAFWVQLIIKLPWNSQCKLLNSFLNLCSAESICGESFSLASVDCSRFSIWDTADVLLPIYDSCLQIVWGDFHSNRPLKARQWKVNVI